MEIVTKDVRPGSVVKTPALLQMLGWENPTAIFSGNQLGYPLFMSLDPSKKSLVQCPWPYGPSSKYAPMPETLEIAEDKHLVAMRKKQLLGNWNGIGFNVSSGTDPEFFVVNGKNEVLPARSFLKDQVESSAFYDGLQGEIAPNTDTCLERLSANISYLLGVVQANAQCVHPEARITLRNHFSFTPEQMQSFSDEDIRFRCSSSLNVYDDGGELPPAREYLHRFAGGHIHIGCGKQPPVVIREMVRALDAIVGVAGVSLARNWDTPERRRMYGRAGEFRLPKHGLEYRVLSNFWLCSPLIFHLTFELMRYAYRIGQAGAIEIVYEGTEDEIRSCINHCDVALAEKLIERNSRLYASIFQTIWARRASQSKAMETLRNGLEYAVVEPDAIVRNWDCRGASYPPTWGRTF